MFFGWQYQKTRQGRTRADRASAGPRRRCCTPTATSGRGGSTRRVRPGCIDSPLGRPLRRRAGPAGSGTGGGLAPGPGRRGGVVAAGRSGVVIVVPDHRDVDRVDAALLDVLGNGHHVRLTADQGPQARYTAWLTASRGHVRCVVGTRSAAFAPVRDLGLVAWGTTATTSTRSPGAIPGRGEVLRLRAALTGAGMLCGGFARSARQQLALTDGTDRPVDAGVPRSALRPHGSSSRGGGASGPAGAARLPSVAWRSAVSALQHGPVPVQVPWRGYVPALRCQDCRAPGRCRRCSARSP